MTSPAAELQKAMHAELTGDAALAAAMGTVRLFDRAPPDTPFPYLTFGRAECRELGDGTEDGMEHLVTISIWSQARGRAEAQHLLHLVRARLHDAVLDLSGHALVNLRALGEEVRFEAGVPAHHGMLRLRAVTEAH